MVRGLAIILTISSILYSCSEKKKTLDEAASNASEKPFDSFIFVGMINRNPGVYKYDVKEKKYSVFWSDKKEKVIELSYSNNRETAFFLTAREFSNLSESGLPFINKVNLYLVNIKTRQISFIGDVGSGLQVFSNWEDNNTFKIIFNSIDKTISNYIQQRTRLYNTFGKKLQDITETYDITKQGYPLPAEQKVRAVSSDGRYSIINYGKDSPSIYLRDSEGGEQYLITKTKKKLEQVEWRNGHLFFLTANPGNGEKSRVSTLFLYSIDKKKILITWEEGVKSFFIVNDYLIFDTGFKENYSINIYNYAAGSTYDKINIKDGCGIRGLPREIRWN